MKADTGLTGLENQAFAVALFGDFNPRILRPAWFRQQDLLVEAELKSVELLVDSAQLVAFTTDRFSLEVSPERCLIHSTSPDAYTRVVDLTRQTFSRLRHTAVRVVGLSREYHFRAETEGALEAVLDRFMPLAPWASLVSGPTERRVSLETPQAEPLNNVLRFEVAKSEEVIPGLYFGVVQEVQLEGTDGEDVVGCKAAVEVLDDLWASIDSAAERSVELLFGAE